MQGKQILSTADLWEAIAQRRSVFVPSVPEWSKPSPAAFVANRPVSMFCRMIAAGMYVYQPKPKGKKC